MRDMLSSSLELASSCERGMELAEIGRLGTSRKSLLIMFTGGPLVLGLSGTAGKTCPNSMATLERLRPELMGGSCMSAIASIKKALPLRLAAPSRPLLRSSSCI